MILWTTPIIAVALYRSDSDSEGHLLTISISHYPLLSVFVFGFSIILHGFEFVTNNNNKKKKKTNIGKIEEVGLVCCWKRRIGFEFFFRAFEWDGYVRKWRKNGGVAISHTLQSDWITVLSQTLLHSRRSSSQKLQICSHFQ